MLSSPRVLLLPRGALLALGVLLGAPNVALAFPTEGPLALCDTYPWSAECRSGLARCTVCHQQPPPVLNAFGLAARAELDPALGRASLAAALRAIETHDSDGDGISNLDELAAGTLPGSEASLHAAVHRSEEATVLGPYTFGRWDPPFALRRAMVAVCGVGPSYAEMNELRSSPDPRAAVHDRVQGCLEEAYWRDEVIPRLADTRVRPVVSLGNCTNMMASFEADYRLFAYAMTSGRDVRDLLLAQYHVRRAEDDSLAILEEPEGGAPPPAAIAGIACTDPFGATPPRNGGQPLAPSRRAGMLTTQWSLVIQTQGTYLPRTTAAHAYRAWLGLDISAYEGLSPISGEPRDIDAAGVQRAPCVHCHSTLDPLSYAFAYYNGVAGFRGTSASGAYDRGRPTTLFSGPAEARAAWSADPPLPWALGMPLPVEAETGEGSSLRELALILAGSRAFAAHIARVIFTELAGAAPGAADQAALDLLIATLESGGYSVDSLVHATIDTDAFGAP